MPKNLLRNGGFERANTNFWSGYDCKSFAVTTAHKHKGTYSGLLTCDGSNTPYVMPNDYIPMTVGEIAYFEAWTKASGMYAAYLRVDYFDEGLSLVETVTYESFNPGTGGFAQLLQVISGIEGAFYCRPYILLSHITEDHWMAIDNVTMYKFTPEDVMGGVRLIDDREELTTAQDYVSPWSIVAPFKEATFLLYVPTLTGTNDTLDVIIESQANFKSNNPTIATFNQVTSSDTEQVLVVTAGLGTKIRAIATLAGTGLDCDYWVEAVFKR